MNKKKLSLILLLVIILSIGLIFTFVGCDKTPVEPVYEILLYDDNWVELEKNVVGNYVHEYVFEYDGQLKGFNAKCFIDGEEFYVYEHGNAKKPNPLSVYYSNAIDSLRNPFPREKGKYVISYEFDIFKQETYYYTQSGRRVRQSDLPEKIQHQMYVTIK